MKIKPRLVLAFIACLLTPAHSEDTKPEAPTPKTILFLGDSITRAGGYVRTIEAELAKQYPGSPPKVINHGRNSETASDLSEAYHPGRRPCVLARIDEELAQNKPDLVVACYGINDGIYHPFTEERFVAYQKGIDALIKKVNASGARLILMTPPPYAAKTPPFPDGADDAAKEAIIAKANAEAEVEAQKDANKFGYRTPYTYYDNVMAQYAKWLLTLDGKDGIRVIDIRTPMLAKAGQTHGGDPIHPNGVGHEIMAKAFLQDWQGNSGKQKVRLFILSGQSNMEGLNPDTTFTPALRNAYPNDEVIVVKYAVGGTPILRWFKEWKAPADAKAPEITDHPGDLYETLMARVKAAVKDKIIDTTTFIWMQGERDAKAGVSAAYEESLKGLIKHVREDLKRPKAAIVIGRLSDHLKADKHWDAVRAIQEKTAKEDPLGGWVDTDDLNGTKDDLHCTKEGYDELGKRFASKAVELLAK